MELLWHGTASIEIRTANGKILIDPFVPLPGAENPTGIEAYDGCTDILVTHGHFDHIASLPQILQRNPSARIYCTKTPYGTLLEKGIPEKNLTEIFFDMPFEIQGISILPLHGKHAILPHIGMHRLLYALRSKYRANVPWILKENRICRENDETVTYFIDHRLLLLGSMNLRDDTSYPEHIEVLVLPYNGWEDNYPEACRIIDRLKPDTVLLDHYDDAFPPATQPLDLTAILDTYKGRVRAMKTGHIYKLGERK